jgi:predicted PurR-regulated permease PerM
MVSPVKSKQSSKPHTLENSLSILGLGISLLLWAINPSFYARAIATIFGIAIFLHLTYRSHFTRRWPDPIKHLTAVVPSVLLMIVAVNSLVPQWKQDHKIPSKTPEESTDSKTKDCSTQSTGPSTAIGEGNIANSGNCNELDKK